MRVGADAERGVTKRGRARGDSPAERGVTVLPSAGAKREVAAQPSAG